LLNWRKYQHERAMRYDHYTQRREIHSWLGGNGVQVVREPHGG
jgi:hypothetical protein